jgi:hypothetical protein
MIGFTSVVCIYSICPVAVRDRCPPALLNVSAHPVTCYASVVRSFKHVLVLVVVNNTETPRRWTQVRNTCRVYKKDTTLK